MDEKVYEPEVIQENPFPTETSQPIVVSTEANTNQVVNPSVSKDKTFPKKRTAVELLSTALNTRSKKILQEFEFAASGAIQVGNFEEGEAGDIRISPNGIVARDTAGITTFALDGTSGDAVFKGQIQSGSLVTGQVVVGNNRVIIDIDNNGEPTIIVNDGTYDRVLIGYGDF